jgi:hypothetical protein
VESQDRESYDTVTAVLNAVYPWAPSDQSSRPSSAAGGRAIHKALEDLAGGQRLSISSYPVGHRNYVQGLLKWWERVKPQVEAIEAPVVSHTHRVSGRIDLLIRCQDDGCCGGKGIQIVDAKTGQIAPTAYVQVGSAYPLLYRETSPRRRLCGSFLLDLSNAPDYDYYPVFAESTDFLAALQWFRVLNRHARDAPDRVLS